jgi:hypothetical protein
VAFEGVEALGPHLSVRLEPCADVAQWPRSKRIDPSRTVDLNGHDAGLTQHPEVLGNCRLGHIQRIDQAADIATATLLRIRTEVVGHCLAEIVQNPAAGVLSHDFEAVHDI